MQPLEPSCEGTIAALEGALSTGGVGQLSPSIVAHIAACSRCQGGLALLASALAGADLPAADCASCQTDLAAFMERERIDAAAAAAEYPDVWRHFWSCPDCFDDYLTARAWLEAEQAGRIAPLQPAVAGPLQQATAAIRRIVLPAHLLALALPAPRLAASPLRGSSGDEFVIFEDGGSDSQAHLTVVVRDSGDGTWQLSVTTNPPIAGRLRLVAGTTQRIATFLSDGSVTLNGIPFAVLSDHSALDLELIILPVRGTAGL